MTEKIHAERDELGPLVTLVSSRLRLSWAIGFYIHHFGADKLDRLYGAMVSPIALAIWLNWGAFGMLLGAEINLSIQSLRSDDHAEEEFKGAMPSRVA